MIGCQGSRHQICCCPPGPTGLQKYCHPVGTFKLRKAGYWRMSLVGVPAQIPRVPVVCPYIPLGEGEGSVLIGLDPGYSQPEKSKSQEREVALLLCQGGIGNCSAHLRLRDSVPPWLSFLEDTSLESFGCWWCSATSDHRKLKLTGYKPGEGRKLRRVRQVAFTGQSLMETKGSLRAE